MSSGIGGAVLLLRESIRRLHVDRAVLFSIATRGWSLIAGPVTLVLVVRNFTQAEQGYFYTFLSLAAFVGLLDLGFAAGMTQSLAHELAHVRWQNRGIEGSLDRINRAGLLLRVVSIWYAALSLIAPGFLFILGWVVFRTHETGINWFNPWLLVCAASAFNILASPLPCLADASDEVADSTRARLIGEVLGFCFLVAGILMGAGLLVPGLLMSGRLVGMTGGLIVKWLPRMRALLRKSREARGVLAIFKEVLPFQSRLALSWIAGVIIFYSTNPIVFTLAGPHEAAVSGFLIQLGNLVQAIPLTWISTRQPRLARLLSQGSFQAAHALMRKLTATSCVLAVFAVVMLIVLLIPLRQIPKYQDRMPLIWNTVLYGGAIVMMTPQFGLTALIRAARLEPFVLTNYVMAGVQCTTLALLASRLGAGAVGLAQTIGILASWPFAWAAYQKSLPKLKAFDQEALK